MYVCECVGAVSVSVWVCECVMVDLLYWEVL